MLRLFVFCSVIFSVLSVPASHLQQVLSADSEWEYGEDWAGDLECPEGMVSPTEEQCKEIAGTDTAGTSLLIVENQLNMPVGCSRWFQRGGSVFWNSNPSPGPDIIAFLSPVCKSA